MPPQIGARSLKLARLLVCALACFAFVTRGVSAKGVLLPIQRRAGGLHSRDLLQNATIPLHGAVRDYGYDVILESAGSPAYFGLLTAPTSLSYAGISMQPCSLGHQLKALRSLLTLGVP